MKKNERLDSNARARKMSKIINRLLRSRGIKRYIIFDGDEEASRTLPGGIYPYSGKLITEQGKLFSFWFDCDEEKQDYTLGRNILEPDGTVYSFWHEVDPKEYEDYAYFIQAKKSLGLLK